MLFHLSIFYQLVMEDISNLFSPNPSSPSHEGVGRTISPIGKKKREKDIYDDEEVVELYVKEVAQIIRHTKHVVVYLGGEISTGAKIPDEKGPTGQWTLKTRGRIPTNEPVIQGVPTFSHVSLSLMHEKGFIKYFTTTNIDGIHRTSGLLPADAVSELRGNFFKETCNKCKREYLRNFDCTSQGFRKDHLTGSNCESCPGQLGIYSLLS